MAFGDIGRCPKPFTNLILDFQYSFDYKFQSIDECVVFGDARTLNPEYRSEYWQRMIKAIGKFIRESVQKYAIQT